MSTVTLLSAALSVAANQPQSVCEQDERVPSAAPSVGVVSDPQNGQSAFCTLTLINDSCAITAGHCLHVLGEARFFSDLSGKSYQHSDEYVYAVDKSWIRAMQTRIGNDWAVVRLKPNRITGLLPGKVHGFVEPELLDSGLSSSGLELHAVRKSSDGFERLRSQGTVLWSDNSILFHDLDTTAGSSGALVLDANSGKAIAIHTHGGCDTMKNNKATLIARSLFLVKAIRECR